MNYRKLDLPTEGSIPAKATAPRPGEPTDLEDLHLALAGLDTVLGSGRRVLLETGLKGATAFMVPDGAPTLSQSRTYPDTATPRVVARAKGVPLTPGHVVALEVVALPSGPTQALDNMQINYEEDSRGGRVELQVTYRNAAGGVKLASASVEIDGSDEADGAEPDDPWEVLITAVDLAMSGPWQPDPVEWSKWTGVGMTVDLVLSYVGSPRVVDVVAVERPWSTTVELDEPRRPAAFYTDDLGAGLAWPPSSYPLVRKSDTDRALGAESVVEAIAETGAVLGPILWSWSSHDESDSMFAIIDYDGGSGDGEAPPVEVQGTDWTLLAPEATLEDPALPGFMAGCFAQGVTQSGAELLDGRSGVIPVWVAAYWRTSNGSAAAELEVRSSSWSVVRVSTLSTDWGWTLTPGWLEVGVSPSSRVMGRCYLRSTGAADTAALRYLLVTGRPR